MTFPNLDHVNSQRIKSVGPNANPETAAVYLWEEGQASLFDFAVIAHGIVGKRDGGTESLANSIRRSVDTVERYAYGGGLWKAMLKKYGSDSECLRDELEISFWNAVGRHYANESMSLEGAKHWLEEAVNNKWTVEKLLSLLPTKNGHSTFLRSAKRIAEQIERELINAPALDVNPLLYKQTVRLLKLAVPLLRRIGKDNGKENQETH